LLDNFISPVILKPRLSDCLLTQSSLQQRVRCTRYIKVNL
jgi:hypothetical protein